MDEYWDYLMQFEDEMKAELYTAMYLEYIMSNVNIPRT